MIWVNSVLMTLSLFGGTGKQATLYTKVIDHYQNDANNVIISGGLMAQAGSQNRMVNVRLTCIFIIDLYLHQKRLYARGINSANTRKSIRQDH